MDLLEREHYFDQLSALLHTATTGNGRTVLISGEAGIGKTALVEQFVNQYCCEVTRLWGACEALFTPRPLGPLYDIAAQAQDSLSQLMSCNTERPMVFSAFLDELQKSTTPTIVVFEDVHWADEATLDLIKFLGRRIPHLPVLFLITYRENELSPDHPLWSVIGDLPGRAMARLSLTPLSEQAVTRLANLANRDAEQLYATTLGNPFFVTEVLASNTEGVPFSVRDAVLARMARLSPDARALLELVCVVPTRIERWLLEAILGSAAEALEECLTSGMLEFSHLTVAFRHELARQAVENTLSPLRSLCLHQKVLQALITHGEQASHPARVVHHALLAHDGAIIARYAPLAAQQASAQGAHREAAAQYQTALLEASQFTAEHLAELLDARAYECYLTNQMHEAVLAQEAALRLWQQLDRPNQVGQGLIWLSCFSWFLGKAGEAGQYAIEAVNLLETLPPTGKLAMAYSNRAQLALMADDTAETLSWGERAMVLAESVGDEETLVHALNNVGTALLEAQDEQGRVHLQRSLHLALKRGWQEHASRAYANLACCAVCARNYQEAEGILQQGLAYCSEHDLDACGMYLQAWQARSSFEQGRWDDAASQVSRVLNHAQLPAVVKIPALAVLGSLQVRRGDPGSIAILDEARALALSTGEPQRIVPVAAARAEAAWLCGNHDQCMLEARAGYDLALTHTDPWKLGELSVWMWRAGGQMCALSKIAEPFARQIKGDWRGAASLWAQMACPYEQALALADGDVTAQHHALALFEQLGAQPAATLVRRRLRQLGIAGIPRGPRPSTRSNLAGLTTRQLEVLRLMAEGLPNAEIASRLFTSPKTVEHHVSAVLAKLGVHSRAQAIRIAYHMEQA
jgi:predicted ATPase/DNA-binding CsgD family transcriptional regulator